MHPVRTLLLLHLLASIPFFAAAESLHPVEWIQVVDKELGLLNSEHALYTWLLTIGEEPDEKSTPKVSLREWKAARCSEARALPRLSQLMKRAIHLMCRGPAFTKQLEQEAYELQSALLDMYNNKELCLTNKTCFHVEPDLEKLMRSSREPSVLQWAWEGWRRITAPEGRAIYPRFIQVQNIAAQNNGYRDMGECWREELEVENLEKEVERLLLEVTPLHRMLHAFVRHRLREFYGPKHISPRGPIPAHLLGNMWSQSWESIADILLNSTLNFDKNLRKKYKNVMEMMREAEQYYISMGMEPMTEKFWKNSVVTKINPSVSCHGTAANLYKKDDYRMLICASVSWEDFYVIHHEMGHIQYYMAYKDLPTVFKEAPNSAFQETIGDTIMLAVETPSHLKRLGIIEKNDDIEIPLLLYQALKKIPHIPFSYIVDKWRWEVMASNITTEDYNKAWWKYRSMYEGLKPPVPRKPGSFDPVAKYHIPDNTPYIRVIPCQFNPSMTPMVSDFNETWHVCFFHGYKYFLSEFLQFQFLEVLCQMKGGKTQEMHLCDLYGFEEAGKKLKFLMSQGSMRTWSTVLYEFSGGEYDKISAKPLLTYFKPLANWLEEQIKNENIPVGW